MPILRFDCHMILFEMFLEKKVHIENLIPELLTLGKNAERDMIPLSVSHPHQRIRKMLGDKFHLCHFNSLFLSSLLPLSTPWSWDGVIP